MGVNSRQVDTELDVLGVDYSQQFIKFTTLIDVLALYTNDGIPDIAEQLINDRKFLALDFYEYDFKFHNFKESDYVFQSNSDLMSNSKIDHKLNYYKYDAFKDNDPASYPIEEFLIFITDDDFLQRLSAMHVSDIPSFFSYYWKIESLLTTNYMIDIGLDADTIEACKNILSHSEYIALDYYKENKKLKEQITALQCDTVKDQRLSCSTTDADYLAVTKQLADAHAKIAELEQAASNGQASQHDDKELAPNSQAGVARLLYALLIEHNYDLSPPKGKGNTNDVLVNASRLHGVPVSKNFVAPWLIRVHQLDIDLKK